MRIVCKNCGAIYSIAEKIIGPKGRMVKCAKCFNAWKVNLAYQTQNNNAINSVESSRKLWLKLLIPILFFILILIPFVFFSKNLIKYKAFESLYEKLSIYEHNDIRLSNSSFRVENDDIIIKCSVTNHSNIDKKMPSIQYLLLDKNKNTVLNSVVNLEYSIIKSGETIPVENRIGNITQPVKYLKIKIANKLDLFIGS